MKILVVQIGRIGDTILTTPVFRAIAEAMPEAQIHALVSRRGIPIVKNNPRLKKIFVYRKNPVSLLSLLVRVRFERYDWWIDPKDHYSRESSLLVRLGGAKNSVGFNGPDKKRFTYGVPSHQELFALHGVERNIAPLAFLGITNVRDRTPELFVDPERQQNPGFHNPSSEVTRILFNISAGDESRYWPVEKWIESARHCLSRGYQVIVVSHPKDNGNAGVLQSDIPEVTLFNSPAIDDVIALMPHVHLVVTPDTSIIHIASAFNVPQIAFFPDVEWNYRKFRPLSQRSIVLR
ncbi:MAG TPA: glycosyltransferase family 9 protein, partial [bacterium]